ncbi:hypothetical protein AK812_SmicGene26034 [Symbiodinium microadriaticum]|uniref:Uncharacterized protein n=1 Tax=Symbiodinium microadriaticum TaxID=2951 RepID=A0A1Q9DAK5_SYMMI|nr:hypothetical protein AK812_SmicGene26034 [Symbiodinium microadriaticum]
MALSLLEAGDRFPSPAIFTRHLLPFDASLVTVLLFHAFHGLRPLSHRVSWQNKECAEVRRSGSAVSEPVEVSVFPERPSNWLLMPLQAFILSLARRLRLESLDPFHHAFEVPALSEPKPPGKGESDKAAFAASPLLPGGTRDRELEPVSYKGLQGQRGVALFRGAEARRGSPEAALAPLAAFPLRKAQETPSFFLTSKSQIRAASKLGFVLAVALILFLGKRGTPGTVGSLAFLKGSANGSGPGCALGSGRGPVPRAAVCLAALVRQPWPRLQCPTEWSFVPRRHSVSTGSTGTELGCFTVWVRERYLDSARDIVRSASSKALRVCPSKSMSCETRPRKKSLVPLRSAAHGLRVCDSTDAESPDAAYVGRRPTSSQKEQSVGIGTLPGTVYMAQASSKLSKGDSEEATGQEAFGGAMCSPEIAQRWPQSRCEETTHRTYRAFEDAACEAFASEAASEAICDLPVLWHRFRSTTPSPRRLSEPLRRLTARTVCRSESSPSVLSEAAGEADTEAVAFEYSSHELVLHTVLSQLAACLFPLPASKFVASERRLRPNDVAKLKVTVRQADADRPLTLGEGQGNRQLLLRSPAVVLFALRWPLLGPLTVLASGARCNHGALPQVRITGAVTPRRGRNTTGDTTGDTTGAALPPRWRAEADVEVRFSTILDRELRSPSREKRENT